MPIFSNFMSASESSSKMCFGTNLFSHIIGQIDNENNGVSGLEKSFDGKLKESNQDLKLTVDLNLQYLIREELIKFQNIFNSISYRPS